MFIKDSVCRENEQIILDVLEREGPMSSRDITRIISGHEIGDKGYYAYSRTVSGTLSRLLRAGHVSSDRTQARALYSFTSALPAKRRPVSAMSEGEHVLHGYTVNVNGDGDIDAVSKDGAPVLIYVPGDVSGRGIRTEVRMPISVSRFRKNISSGRYATEVIG